MKKKIILVTCLINLCYAQPREKLVPVAPAIKPRETINFEVHDIDPKHKKSCPVVQDMLTEDFSFDEEESVSEVTVPESSLEQPGVISRMQDMLTIVGIQAILGAMYISEISCTCYNWLKEHITSRAP